MEQNKKRQVKKKKKINLNVKKNFKQIQFDQRKSRQNRRAFKGNSNDTNLLNINFKTKVCQILQQMNHAKQIVDDQIKAMHEFKQSHPSFESLVNLIYRQKKPNRIQRSINKIQSDPKRSKERKQVETQYEVKSQKIYSRLRRVFHSPQIVKRIFKNEGTVVNKLLMLKYIEAMRYTIIGKGEIVKWKQCRDIVTPE